MARMYSIATLLLLLTSCLVDGDEIPIEVRIIRSAIRKCTSENVKVYPQVESTLYFENESITMGNFQLLGLHHGNAIEQPYSVTNDGPDYKIVAITFSLSGLGVIYGKPQPYRTKELYTNKFYAEVRLRNAPHCTFKVLKLEVVSFPEIKADPYAIFGKYLEHTTKEGIDIFQKDFQEIVEQFLLDHIKSNVERAIGLYSKTKGCVPAIGC